MTKIAGEAVLATRAARYLANIERSNKQINALVSLYPAEKVQKYAEETGDPLVIAIKDNFSTADLPTTCSSEMLRNYKSPYESSVVTLLKDEGFNLIGKANMDEFAMGTNNTFSCFGPTLNPLYEEPTSPGGSSGGSAAAVAAEFCDVALGTDTGGSVRLPAAYCSVYGFKPSYGLISRYGVVSYAQSLDTVGILAREVKHIARVFHVLNQYDQRDPTSLCPELRQTLGSRQKKEAKGLRIGILSQAILEMSPEIKKAWAGVLEDLQDQGHTIHTVSVPTMKYALPTYFMVSPAEASSNLARYDGIRYGTRAETDRDSHDTLYAPTRTEGFGPEVQRRLLLGTFNLSAGAFEGHFKKALMVRRIIRDEFNALFASKNVLVEEDYETGDIDVLVHPTALTPPPSLDKINHGDPIEHYTNDVLTVPANLAGLPAISVPRGKGAGMQVWGQYGDDELVLSVAAQISKQ